MEIVDWWDINARAGIDRYTTESFTYRGPGGAVVERYQNGYLGKGIMTYQYITTNVMSNMHKTFGAWDLGLLIGTCTEATKTNNITRWGYNFETEGTISFNNISTTNQFFKDNTSRHRMVGLYGEARASYKSIAYLAVTGRNDLSSTLPYQSRS